MVALIFVAVGCLAILWLCYRHYYEPYFILKRSIGLPGPTPEPFFGNPRPIADKGWIACTKEWTNKYGPTFLYFIGIQPVIFTQDPEIIRVVFATKAGNFGDRFKLPFLFTDDSKGLRQVNSIARAPYYDWKRMHSVLSPFFSSKKVAQTGPLVEVCCTRMMQRVDKHLHDTDTIDVCKLFGDFVMETMMTTAFGIDFDSQSNEGKQLLECLNVLSGTGGSTSIWGLVGMSTIISHASWTILLFQALTTRLLVGQRWNYVKELTKLIVDERCIDKTKRTDALQRMVDSLYDGASKDMAFSKLEVYVNARVFIYAGCEFTKIVLSMTCYCLAANPKIQEQAFNKMDEFFTENPDASLYEAVVSIPYIEMIVLEAVRHYFPLQEIQRYCVKSCAVNDELFIPKGTLVYVAIKNVNFSSEYWSNPDTFDPERFDPSISISNSEGFLSFGMGPRSCIGKRLALLDVRMGLASILRKYKLELVDDTYIEMDTSGMAAHPKYGVKLKFVLR